jgi:ComF family protein
MAYPERRRESASACASVARAAGVLRARVDMLLDLVPAECPLCRGKARAGALCPDCLAEVTASMADGRPRCATCALPLDGLPACPACPDCAAVPPAFDRVVAAFDYVFPGDLLIHHLKEQKRFASVRMLSGILARRIGQDAAGLPRHTILVPVPSSRASIRRRGFNPAAEVARALARRLGLACRPSLLRRVREGERQASLPRAGRILNAQGLYACATRVDGCDIAIVDDVLTTGSTAHAIAQAFRRAGAASVCVVVLARTRHHFSS